jgi:hypothetical protein
MRSALSGEIKAIEFHPFVKVAKYLDPRNVIPYDVIWRAQASVRNMTGGSSASGSSQVRHPAVRSLREMLVTEKPEADKIFEVSIQAITAVSASRTPQKADLDALSYVGHAAVDMARPLEEIVEDLKRKVWTRFGIPDVRWIPPVRQLGWRVKRESCGVTAPCLCQASVSALAAG